ncbi:hypothetical protein ScPMuIL_013062 [Solemya velum]
MALSAAEKQRRYRERRDADPEKRARYLLKSKQKYKTDRDVGKNKRKPSSNMTAREHRHLKKMWRKQKQQYRKNQKEKKSLEENLLTPPRSPATPNPPSRQFQQSVKKSKMLRAKCYRDNHLLKTQLDKMEKKVDMYRKRWKRSTNKADVSTNIPDTPRTKTRKLLRCLSGKTLRKTLDFHHALIAELREKYKQGKKTVAAIVSGSIMKKYRCRKHARNEIGISTKRGSHSKIGSLSKRLKQEVHTFFERDDVSRITTGKKETVTKHKVKKQRRILLDTISNLYRKYVSEDSRKIGFSTFCKLRPFWVTPPKEKDRKTCLCKTCENTQYLADALHKVGCLDSRDMEIITRQAACSTTSQKCMYSECDMCNEMDITNDQIRGKRDMTVSWTQWKNVKEERVLKSGVKKDVVLTVNETVTGTVDELLDSFYDMLCLYKKHTFNIRNQLHHYKVLQQSMPPTECLIHVDFAENYNGKMTKAIQCMHFGANQPQISLHTGFYKIGGVSKSVSFCGVSDSLNHGPASIWAYLKPVLEKIKTDHPCVNFVHFYSDGPTTQYRQKSNFYLFSTEVTDLGFEGSTWNFMEAGHGKGIPDGVGATVKRVADQRVLCGSDIMNARSLLLEVQKNSTIYLYEVKEAQITAIEEILERQTLKPVPGTMKLHQVILDKSPGHILYRDISCMCLEKTCDGHALKTFSFPINTRKNVLADKRKLPPETGNQHPIQKKRLKTRSKNSMLTVKTMCKKGVEDRKRMAMYEEHLKRFQKCKSFDELKSTCQTVLQEDLTGTSRYVLEGFDVDTDAMDLYPTDVPGSGVQYPVKVIADGNCMVGCGSIYAFGNDTHVAEIRARVVIELVLNEEYYLQEDNLKKGTDESTWTSTTKQAFAMYSEQYIPGTRLSEEIIKTIYELEVMQACKPKTYLGIWQLFGIASILQMPVFSVYPELGNPLVRQDLHRLIQPRVRKCDDIAYIMWSSTRKDMTSSNWVPNHFVAVLSVDTESETSKVTVDGESNPVDTERETSTVTVTSESKPVDTETETPTATLASESHPVDTETETSKVTLASKSNPVDTETETPKVNVASEPNPVDTETETPTATIASESHPVDTETETSKVNVASESQPPGVQKASPDVLLPEVPPTKDCFGKYVVVVYNGVPYPGYVEDTTECDVYVSCMHQVGRDPGKNCFFWPKAIKDKCWYEHHNILAIIPEPQKIDSSYRHYEVAPALWRIIVQLTQSERSKYISECIEEAKQELRQDNMAVKANAVNKLTYLQMLGYDVSWAAFNVIEVMSSPKFTFKRMGYLAASLSFHDDTDVLM